MKFLVATGGAPHSDTAVRFTAHLAADRDQITLLTVVKQKSGQAHGQAILVQAQQLIEKPDQQIETILRIGHPAEEIIREAEEGKCDLVVVGERQHHSLLTRFLVGATAERVIEHAPCPVVVAKGSIHPLQRILLCDSGLKMPPLVERFVEQLSDLLNNNYTITVLHVMSQISAAPSVPSAHLGAGTQAHIAAHTPEGELLVRDIQHLQKVSIHAEAKVRYGRVVDEILAEAYQGHYDLVVIGAHRGESDWRRILLDDLAHQIISQIDRPILVVR